LDTSKPSAFLLEGVAVYLSLDVLEQILAQFRQVSPDTGVLAISVSTSAEGAQRQRFSERVAEVGEPARSFLSADEARDLLARAGWHVTDPDGPQGAWRGAAGLLAARPAGYLPERHSPLSALAAHALVAYTIEFDNEFEHRMPHQTTDHGLAPGAPRGAPWLTSLVMWANCVRHVPDDGITVAELTRSARRGTNLDGMRRWGYVTLTSPSGEVAGRAGRASALPKIKPDTVVRLTEWGRTASRIWADLDGVIEARWQARLGAETAGGLRDALAAVVRQLVPPPPDVMPILRHGLFTGTDSPDSGTARPDSPTASPADSPIASPAAPPVASSRISDISDMGEDGRDVSDGEGGRDVSDGKCGRDAGDGLAGLPLWALLSRLLAAFAAEFESESDVSLAISATVLRVVTADGVRPMDIPALAGVSREAVAMALGVLRSSGLATEEPAPAGGRGKVVRLTSAGTAARARYAGLTAGIEERWRTRYGAEAVDALRGALEGIGEKLGEGLALYAEGWRATRGTRVVPDYPMILHRGGYPDGA
ncbi:MAG: hypothetical protein ACRDN0_04615, partial [Trebonia sp.]